MSRGKTSKGTWCIVTGMVLSLTVAMVDRRVVPQACAAAKGAKKGAKAKKPAETAEEEVKAPDAAGTAKLQDAGNDEPARESPATDAATNAIIQAAIERARTDPERAQMLYEAAQIASQKEKTQTALLEKCVEYALRSCSLPASRELAEKALDQLSRTVGDRACDWALRKADLYSASLGQVRNEEKVAIGKKLVAALMEAGQAMEDAGRWEEATEAYYRAKTPAYHLKLPELEEINTRHRNASVMQKAVRNMAAWKEAVAKNPKNLSARMLLIRSLVVEMDRPQEAAQYLTDEVDQSWRTYVPLAGRTIEQLTPIACKDLGDWYYRELLTRTTPPAAEQILLRRAKRYYEKALLAPGLGQNDQTLVRIALKQIEQRGIQQESAKPLVIKLNSNTSEGELAAVRLTPTAKVRSGSESRVEAAPAELQGSWIIQTNGHVGCHWLPAKGLIEVSRPCTLYVAVCTEHAGSKLITEETFAALAEKGWRRLSDGKRFRVPGTQKWDVISRRIESAGVVDVPQPHLSDNKVFGVTLIFFLK